MGTWVSKGRFAGFHNARFPPVDPPASQGLCSPGVIAQMMPTLPSYDSNVAAGFSPPTTVWPPLERNQIPGSMGGHGHSTWPRGGAGETFVKEQKGRKNG